MGITKQEMLEMAELVAQAVVNALKKENIIGIGGKAETTSNKKSEKSAYAKTESLLYNYRGFQRIVKERLEEIESLRTYGVPRKSTDIVQWSGGSGSVGGTVLPEESVERAVRTVEESMRDTVQAIALVDKCMGALSSDPYYKVLEMRYFDGRTLEDIGAYFNCDHSTISRNKSRLVKELAMRLFPNEVIKEYMN
jgi:RNA polymerase sigma factor (sigma-70 family)